jgi:hypothetical protein
MSRAPRRLRPPEAGDGSEFLDAMQEATDILIGKRTPALLQVPEDLAAAATERVARQV